MSIREHPTDHDSKFPANAKVLSSQLPTPEESAQNEHRENHPSNPHGIETLSEPNNPLDRLRDRSIDRRVVYSKLNSIDPAMASIFEALATNSLLGDYGVTCFFDARAVAKKLDELGVPYVISREDGVNIAGINEAQFNVLSKANVDIRLSSRTAQESMSIHPHPTPEESAQNEHRENHNSNPHGIETLSEPNNPLDRLRDRSLDRHGVYSKLNAIDPEMASIFEAFTTNSLLGDYGVTCFFDARTVAKKLDELGIPYVVSREDGTNEAHCNVFSKADVDTRKVWGDIYVRRIRELGGVVAMYHGCEFLNIWPNYTLHEVAEIRSGIEKEVRSKRDELGYSDTLDKQEEVHSGALHINYGLAEGIPGKFAEQEDLADELQKVQKLRELIDIAAKSGKALNRKHNGRGDVTWNTRHGLPEKASSQDQLVYLAYHGKTQDVRAAAAGSLSKAERLGVFPPRKRPVPPDNHPFLCRVSTSNVKDIPCATPNGAPGMIATIRQGIKQGTLCDLDIKDIIAGAVNKFAYLKSNGESVKNFLRQTNMFGGDLTADQKKILEYIDGSCKSPYQVQAFFQSYIDGVNLIKNSKQLSLMGCERAVPTLSEIIDRAIARAKSEDNGPDKLLISNTKPPPPLL